MYIEYIKMHKYRWFLKLQSDTLEVFFNTSVAIIKGGNGTGKTSLKRELTPLPSDKENYKEGGYKIIRIRHENRHYELKSDFSGRSPKYSFICDGLELNEAGLITAQKELVFQHFGINVTLHNIMIGDEKFTNMSINARKKLISTLTKLNIEHVLKAYGKLNDELNLFKLMLKNEQTQYKTEESKLVTPSELEEIKGKLDHYEEGIDKFLDVRNMLSRYMNTESTDEALQQMLEDESLRSNLIKENYNLLTSHSPERVGIRLSELNDLFVRYDNELRMLYGELEELEIERNSLTNNKEEDIQVLLSQEKYLLQAHDELPKDFIFTTEYSEDLYRAYINVYDEAVPILREMPSNIDSDGYNIYGKKTYTLSMEKRNSLMEELQRLRTSEEMIMERKKRLSEFDGDVTCPKCHHSWHPIDTECKDDEVTLNSIGVKRESIKKELVEIDDFLKRSEEYFNNYKILMRIQNKTSVVLSLFWKRVMGNNMIATSPEQVRDQIDILSKEIEVRKLLEDNKEVLKDLQSRILLHRGNVENLVERIVLRIEHKNRKIEETMYYLEQVKDEEQKLEKASYLYEEINKFNSMIKFNMGRFQEHNLTLWLSEMCNTLDNYIRDFKLKIVDLNNIIHAQNTVQYTLNKHKEKINDIEESIKVLNIILEEVSPKNGIIAKTISSFLNNLIENINQTIDRIWTYKMELKPIDVTTGNLDYKFGINVDDVIDTKDISKASEGMKEAINLSFVIMIYKLLGFDQYGLFLDEVASNMDNYHTENILKLINSLANESNFRQLFIINHKDNLGFLSDVQFIHLE